MLLALLIAATPASKPEAQLLERYRVQQLQLKMPTVAEWIFLGAFNAPNLQRQGAPVDVGYFGGRADEVFAESPLALEHAKRYRSRKISGFTLSLIGIAAGVAGACVMTLAPSNEAKIAGVIMYVGALASGLTGTILQYAAMRHLERAVDAYNTDLYSQMMAARREVVFRYAITLP